MIDQTQVNSPLSASLVMATIPPATNVDWGRKPNLSAIQNNL